MKHKSADGVFFGDRAPIRTGLPQRRVLSPLLWLMFFNDLPADLQRRRTERWGELATFLDLICADDVTTIIVPSELNKLRECAWSNVGDVRGSMGRRTLQIQDPKNYDILYAPETINSGPFRRAPPLSYLSTKVRRKRQYELEA